MNTQAGQAERQIEFGELLRVQSTKILLVAGLTAALFSSAIASFGITGILEGRVIDKQTREALVGVNVILVGTGLGNASDGEGFYQISNVRAGIYDVRISLIGYKTVIVRKVTIVQDQRTRLNIDLEQSAIQTEVVEIRAERPLIQKDQGSTVFYIGEVKLDRLPISTFRDVLLLQPGTSLEGNVRGAKTNEVLFLVDGLPIQDVIGGGLGTNVPKSAITGLTIHTGGFEAEYGNAMSGVVNVVTKSGSERTQAALKVEQDSWVPSAISTQVDHYSEIEFTASGPLSGKDITYFSANNYSISDTRWWQDFQEFFKSPIQTEYTGIGKIDFMLSPSSKLSVQGIYSYKRWRDYEFTWRFNLGGLPPRKRASSRVSIGYNYIVSNSSFFNLTLNRYEQRNLIGNEEGIGPTLSAYEYDFFLRYILSGNRNWWADARQTIYTLKSDFTMNVLKTHMVKFGLELNQYDVNSDLVKYDPQLTYFGKPIPTEPRLNYSNVYRYQPRSGSAYVQDKVELERDGSIFTFGVRLDFLDPTADRPIVEFVPSTPNEYRDTVKGFAKASLKYQVSPRLSFAAPVGPSGFFFINFGQYFQFPLFEYLYSGINPTQVRQGWRNVQAGNPDLEPERTVSWEVGFKQSIDAKHVLSVTYFRKKMQNQIDTKTLIPFDSKSAGDHGFATYVNNAEASSSGLEFVVSREKDEKLSGSLSYTFMQTDGISESVNQGLNISQWGFAIPAQTFPLSWDQRHTVKADADFLSVGDIRGNVTLLFNSPRPYTYYPTRDGFTPLDSSKVFVPNNARMQNVLIVNAKFSREFTFANSSATLAVYVDIRNLLNAKNVRWMDSNGRIGGELGDPSAYYDPRRVHIGLRVEF